MPGAAGRSERLAGTRLSQTAARQALDKMNLMAQKAGMRASPHPLGTPLFMRAPGEAPGSIALESAIDEMAQVCGTDPLAFRLKDYVEPISGKPFSSKALRE